MQVRKGHFLRIPDPPKYPEKILFCGWRRDIDDMIMVILYIVLSSYLEHHYLFNKRIQTLHSKSNLVPMFIILMPVKLYNFLLVNYSMND